MGWRSTDLSVQPPSWQMADTDRETFQFDAQEAIASAEAVVTRLDTGEVAGGPVQTGGAGSGVIEAAQLSGTTVLVTISGLTRDVSYELAVTFKKSPTGRAWSRTLVLDCVA